MIVIQIRRYFHERIVNTYIFYGAILVEIHTIPLKLLKFSLEYKSENNILRLSVAIPHEEMVTLESDDGAFLLWAAIKLVSADWEFGLVR